MTDRLPAPGDSDGVSRALTQAYLFVSSVNANAAVAAFQEKQLPFQEDVVRRLREAIAGGRHQWSEASETVRLFKRLGCLPPPDIAVVNGVAAVMTRRPATALNTKYARGREAEDGAARVRISVSRRHRHNVFIFSTLDMDGFSTVDSTTRPARRLRGQLSIFDPPYDPISILEGFCAEELGVRTTHVDHTIQQWVRNQFLRRRIPSNEPEHSAKIAAIKHSVVHKVMIAEICAAVNDLFYGAGQPSSSQVHSVRVPTVDAGTLIRTVARVLIREDEEPGATPGPSPLLLMQAFGFYALLRFNRSIRCQYGWFEPASSKVSTEGDSREDPTNLGSRDHPRLCVSVTGRVESGHVQTRLFGAITGLPGLNFAFKGGVLPRDPRGHTLLIQGPPGSGKTALATHLAADVALRGRFAAIVSVEEDHRSVVDRLLTFGLYDPNLYEVILRSDGSRPSWLKDRLTDLHQQGKGALYLYRGDGPDSDELPDIFGTIHDALTDLPRYRWRCIVVDSLEALEASLAFASRSAIRHTLHGLEDLGFWGIVVGETEGRFLRDLAFLADSQIELGRAEGGTRWLLLKKCRMQEVHLGPHSFEIRQGRGLTVYPSLPAIQSSRRRRIKATLSEERTIFLESPWRTELGIDSVREKSSTLIWGESGSGKTELALRLATSPAGNLQHSGGKAEPPRSVLVVNFRTSERQFMQSLEETEGLVARWNNVVSPMVRWYSPGTNLDGPQLVDDLRHYIKQSRQSGLGLERIVFDEIEAVDYFLPQLARDPQLWPTILELLGTEPITAFFVMGFNDEVRPSGFGVLRSGCTYVLRVSRRRHRSELERQPGV